MFTKIKATIRSTAARFAMDRGGNFAMMTALCVPVLFGAAGLALDTTKSFGAKTHLNNAIDAAVLAVTRDLTLGNIDVGQAREMAMRFVSANLDESPIRNLSVSIDQLVVNETEKSVAIGASVVVPTNFMAVLGQDQTKVATYSKAAYSNTSVEVAMALDVTGSMKGAKIAALKNAAKNAVDILISNSVEADRVRIGLVPYASTVNIRPVIGKVATTPTNDTCVYERTGTNAFNDTFANSANPVSGNNGAGTCVNNEIVEMTNNVGQLRSAINGLNANGWTAGHLGVSWAHYMLSPEWNQAWSFNSDVSGYNSGTKKFAILMTDGEFNTYLSKGTGEGSEPAASNNAAKRMCDSMKSNKIKVYTIAFQAPADAQAIMQECASSIEQAGDQFYFNAANAAQLEAAFDEIARDIEGLRLVN